jgi:hypothetical protein
VKRLIFLSILLTLVALGLSGDHIAGRILDARLGPLLTEQLGLPVKLAPIKAKLWRLRARSPTLVMGDSADPAVEAADVTVTLSLPALLRGEIRLASASASDLMVRPARWPSSGEPLPDDYLFLDPWLPDNLQLDKGRYLTDAGTAYPVRQFHWRRPLGGGARVDWREDRNAGEMRFKAMLESLQDLLRLAPISLHTTAQAPVGKASDIDLHATVKPDAASGYTLQARLSGADMSAEIVTGNNQAWQLPLDSTTTIGRLQVDKLAKLIDYYTRSEIAKEPESWLGEALPGLPLIGHQGKVSIDEVRLGDEILKHNSFDFSTGEQGLEISKLQASGPSGILRGHFRILSDPQEWQLNLTADISARLTDQSIAEQFIGADWRWHAGHMQVDGHGKSWGTLLDSLQGDITLEGLHRGESHTPVKMQARLDNRQGALALEQIDMQLGSGHITGSVSLSGDDQRLITADIRAEQLDLHFLFHESKGNTEPGIAIPEYLAALPGIELDWKMAINGLRLPGLDIASADLALQRKPTAGKFTATVSGRESGKLVLALDAQTPPGKPSDVDLNIQLDQLNIPKLFQQETLLHSHSTGSVIFTGKGEGLEAIFKAMRGTSRLSMDVRSDNNWTRQTTAEERLQLAGNAELVIHGQRIVGVKIDNLDIDSTQQDITGKVSLVSGRVPWLVADMEAEKLDIAGLIALMPDSPASVDKTDILATLRSLGATRMSLDAKSVLARNTPLMDVKVEVTTGPDKLLLDRLDFKLEGSPLTSKGSIEWRGKTAAFSALAQTTDFNLDRFLIEQADFTPVPVSGSTALESSGRTFSELLANLSGDVHLKNRQAPAELKKRRDIQMTIRRIPNGMHATISKLQLGESDLTGSVRYLDTTPAQLEIEVAGGSLSLLPWEAQAREQAATKPAAKKEPSLLGGAAQTSARLVGRALSAPSKLLVGPGEAAPGDKYFSSDPLPFNTLHKLHANFKGRMDALTGTEHVIRDLSLDGSVKDGQLSLEASAGELNRGSARLQLAVNSTAVPPTVSMTTNFDKIAGVADKPAPPKSGFASLTSSGGSMAEIAANLNGQAYLEFGEGPFNYGNLTLLNADLAARAFKSLIPGLEQTQPRLGCAVSMATIKDGQAITPHGYAARTNQANLIGRIAIDLQKEMVKLHFDSRSREGIGLSVGNVFSNTIQIKGPLTDPQIVPQTTGLLWRGWAAFMTAGLSVVAESVLKRALASENPCKAIREHIQKDVCSTTQPLASSPLVCDQAKPTG